MNSTGIFRLGQRRCHEKRLPPGIGVALWANHAGDCGRALQLLVSRVFLAAPATADRLRGGARGFHFEQLLWSDP